MELKQSSVSNKLLKIGGAATAAVIVVAGLYYYYYIRPTKKPPAANNTHVSTSQSDNNRLFKQQSWFDHRYKEVIQTIKCHFDGKNLTLQAIKAISKGQYTLAQRDYKACVLRSRQQRRVLKKQKNKGEYANSVLRADLQIEAILEKHLNAILARFNIPRDFWMSEIGQWVTSSQEASEEWESIIQQAENCLLDTLRESDQFYSYNTVKNVLNLKLKTISQLSPEQLDLHAAPDQTATFNMIDKYLWDVVWVALHVEEENFNFSLRYLKPNQKDEIDLLLEQITLKTKVLLYGNQGQQDQQKAEQQIQQGQIKAAQVPNEDEDDYY